MMLEKNVVNRTTMFSGGGRPPVYDEVLVTESRVQAVVPSEEPLYEEIV